jgi:Flp pilus assembly protein TadB
MIFVVVALTALSVGLLIFAVAGMAPGQSRVVRDRLATLQSGGSGYRELKERRRRQQKRERESDATRREQLDDEALKSLRRTEVRITVAEGGGMPAGSV